MFHLVFKNDLKYSKSAYLVYLVALFYLKLCVFKVIYGNQIGHLSQHKNLPNLTTLLTT